MKQQKIKHAILFCLLVAIWGALAASLFGSCNVYEYEDVEIIHCPQIQDTIQIPNWEPEE